MKAFVLIKVPALRTQGVVTTIRDFPGVEHAWALYGDVDLIAELNVDNLPQLDDLIMNQIQGVPQVDSTRTYIVVESPTLLP